MRSREVLLFTWNSVEEIKNEFITILFKNQHHLFSFIRPYSISVHIHILLLHSCTCVHTIRIHNSFQTLRHIYHWNWFPLCHSNSRCASDRASSAEQSGWGRPRAAELVQAKRTNIGLEHVQGACCVVGQWRCKKGTAQQFGICCGWVWGLWQRSGTDSTPKWPRLDPESTQKLKWIH